MGGSSDPHYNYSCVFGFLIRIIILLFHCTYVQKSSHVLKSDGASMDPLPYLSILTVTKKNTLFHRKKKKKTCRLITIVKKTQLCEWCWPEIGPASRCSRPPAPHSSDRLHLTAHWASVQPCTALNVGTASPSGTAPWRPCECRRECPLKYHPL